MKMKEEQEDYIIKAQHEKLVLKQEMENKSKFLEEAQLQLEEVRFNRERMDQDVMVSGRRDVAASSHGEIYSLLLPQKHTIYSSSPLSVPLCHTLVKII